MIHAPRHTSRSRIIATVLTAFAFTLSGCGGGASEPASGNKSVTVGVLPNLDVAPVYLGEKMGFFKKRGLDLRFEVAQGGAALVPSVLSGQYQFGFSNAVSLIVARDKNLPLKMIAAGSESTNKTPDVSAVLVRGDSKLKTAKDLEGRSVAVNLLNSAGSITVRQSIRKAGGDPDKVKFIELGFADMLPALAKGRIDAAFSVEPFITTATSHGDRVLAWNYLDTGENFVASSYFTAEKLLSSDPDLVKKFQAGIKESREYARNHPDEVRAIAATYTDIAPEILGKLTLPVYPEDINQKSVQRQADLALEDGVIGKPLDIAGLLP